MVAFHFPPLAGSSGIQRTLRFAQHLPPLGWQPLILSAHPRAYESTSADLLSQVPSGTVVRRAFALDTGRHLQLFGRYLACMARPDRWVVWKFAAIREGLRMVDEFKPDVIWSTYPIATAHVIASELQRKTCIPWVADFRDPMAHTGFPADPRTWQSYLQVEADAAERAQYRVFTTPGAAQIYRERYPAMASRILVLENGYDEESFALAARHLQPLLQASNPTTDMRPFVMLHSGIVYPSERDPSHLFMALGRLREQGILMPTDLRIRFRAPVHEEFLQQLAQSHGALEFIEVCPALPYREALAEMLSVDALLVMQASNCNAQIPAKLYEYLRAGKPVLGLTDPAGDTAAVMRGAGLNDIARLDSANEIMLLLSALVGDLRSGKATLPLQGVVAQASRRARSAMFAALLSRTVGSIAVANTPA